MEWIINQLRDHPELAIFPHFIRRLLAGQIQNRKIFVGNSNQRATGRSTGGTIKH